MIARWDNKDYKILNSIEIEKSSREVTYTDLTLDFSKCTIDNLPFAQQEVQIIDKNGNLKFTGFVSDYQLPELKKIVTPQKELSLSLFSPRQMTTKRTVTITRTCKLIEAINQALAPMYEDGFVLNEVNVPDKTVTVNLISRTIEETMNYFSNKYSLYWNIDELKNITVNSIEYQFNKPIKKEININNYKEQIKGFLSLTPSVETSDYANIINIKNARIFYNLENITLNITLENGDRWDFENPIDISLDTAKRIAGASYTNGVTSYVTNLLINCSDGTSLAILSTLNSEVGDTQNITNVATDDSTGAMFVLEMDSTFKNLATGITYKGSESKTITYIKTDTILKYANMKLLNWEEINKNQGKTTLSGQIERTVDVEESWYTINELVEYIRSLFVVNNKYTNQVNIVCDEDNDIELGDRISIELAEYFVQGNYVVTAIKENKEGNNPTQYNIELRNTGLTENFIDLFRSSADAVEQTSQIESEYVVEYSEGDGIKEVYMYDFKEYNPLHTLNFILNV